MKRHDIPATDHEPPKIKLADDLSGTTVRVLSAIGLFGVRTRQRVERDGLSVQFSPEQIEAVHLRLSRTHQRVEGAIAPDRELTIEEPDAPIVVAAIRDALAEIEAA